MNTYRRLILISAALALQACAGPKAITLRYAPDFPGVPAGTGHRISMHPLEDARSDKGLGKKASFFGKAPITAPGQSVPLWVSSSIEAELREAGFRIEEGGALALRTSLLDFRAGPSAGIRLRAALYRGEEVLFEKEYSETEPVPLTGGTPATEAGLQAAMRRVNVRLVYDVIGRL
jgi:hypothetical protein